MILLKLCRNFIFRLLLVMVIISSLVVPPAYSQETEDSQVFIAGFNAYQQKDYASSIEKMNEVLQKYPDSPLRDMALFWLSRSYYKTGNQQEAARFLAQFSKEYPDNPLKSTVEDELLSLVARFEKGEKLSVGSPPAKQPDRLAAQKAKAEKERVAAAKAEEAKRAAAVAEAARVAALKQAEDNAAAEKKEQARVAAEKAERERLTLAKAEEAKRAAEAAALESARVAALKLAEEKALAEKKELERIATAKAEQERLTSAKLEEERLAAAEAARVAALKRTEEKAAAEKQEMERIAAVKAEQEQLAQKTAAYEKAEKQRIAAIKSEEARKIAEQERIAAANAEKEKQAAAAAAAEAARVAALKLAEEKAVAEKQELERIAAVKAEQERIAQEMAANEKAEQQRLAAINAEERLRAEAAAETARIAAQKAEETRLANEKAELERIAQAEAELNSMNALRAENERKALIEKAEREKIALAKAEDANKAIAAAEAARLAASRAEDERKTAEAVAKEAEINRIAAVKAEEARLAQQRVLEEKNTSSKLAYREKAIGQYKAIIDKFPSSTAAVTAAAKLRELGVAVALPPKVVEELLPENAQILRIEVAQFAGFEFSLPPHPDSFIVGRQITVPFEVVNRGNGNDSFTLESAFPAEFKARFTSVAAPGVTINQTPELVAGETFKGLIELVIPPGSIDGLRITHPVKAASRLMAEASQSREVKLVASAPLIRAIVRTEKVKPRPGDKVVYRVAILNVGSTGAQDVTFRLNFPPQLEPVDYSSSGFRQEAKSALVLDGLQINSGENREFNITFQLKDDSLAGQELSARAELINNQLKTAASFVSNVAYVEPQRGVTVRAGSERLVIIPGQTITAPFVVTNTGNIREKFKITSTITGARNATVFNDLNRDGIHQASEPVISEIGPLAPREEASIAVELKSPNNAADGSSGNILVTFVSEGDSTLSASGVSQLTYSRPVLKMIMAAGRDGRPKPGDIASFDLTVTNNGSNLARVVELQSTWPEQLELIAAVPDTSSTSGGNIIWRFKEMGAGEKRTIKVSFRVKTGTGVGTAIQVKNVLTYEDQLGNRY